MVARTTIEVVNPVHLKIDKTWRQDFDIGGL
jgi:hypothetical protein